MSSDNQTVGNSNLKKQDLTQLVSKFCFLIQLKLKKKLIIMKCRERCDTRLSTDILELTRFHKNFLRLRLA